MDVTILHFKICTIVCCGLYCAAEYTDFTTLLWLKASENVDPADVWYNSTSEYNDATNMTSQTLQNGVLNGYRNTMIDSWSTVAPDKIRVSYLNADGLSLFSEEFNSTGSTMLDWFSSTRTFSAAVGDGYSFNRSYGSYKVSFSHENSDWGVKRYKSVVIPKYDGVTHFLVHNQDGTRILPAAELDATARCHLSYLNSNIFAFNTSEVTNLVHEFCSSICRENNYATGAVHGRFCSCIDGPVAGAAITVCNTTCEGNASQTCGGIHPTFPPEAVIFDTVTTDIDTTQFDTPLAHYETFDVNGTDEVSYGAKRIIHGYQITAPSTVLPKTVRFEMISSSLDCSYINTSSTTFVQTFFMQNISHSLYLSQPIVVQCVNFTLYDDGYKLLTFPLEITTIAVKDNKFVSASILSIEAAWWIEPNVTNTTVEEQCECECWVHNLLYGDSPYNNLTYSEIEDALRNVTDKLERELAVNKSELSSTIRSKTSAEDNRKSATAVGYTLGVALLTLSIGGIVLADVPKLMGNIRIMRENLQSRFCRDKSPPPDVTLTTSSNQTSRIT